ARVRKSYGSGLGEPTSYDLVLTTERVSNECCVEQVVQLVRRPEFQPTPESIAQVRNMALATRVRTAFRDHPEGAGIEVGVDVSNGSVTLSGIVVNEAEKKLAADIAAAVPDVKAVDNQLSVMRRR